MSPSAATTLDQEIVLNTTSVQVKELAVDVAEAASPDEEAGTISHMVQMPKLHILGSHHICQRNTVATINPNRHCSIRRVHLCNWKHQSN